MYNLLRFKIYNNSFHPYEMVLRLSKTIIKEHISTNQLMIYNFTFLFLLTGT